MGKSTKTGAEIDQAQMVQVRSVLHAAGECQSYETSDDVARVLRERDELRAEIERLRAALDMVAEEREAWKARALSLPQAPCRHADHPADA
jgi:hypothetical protein